MSRRARGFALAGLAVALAVMAAALAERHRGGLERELGGSRSVAVVLRDIEAGRLIGEAELERALGTAKVPARFVPPTALADPRAALGAESAVGLAAGSYLTAESLAEPRAEREAPRWPGAGRVPLELSVEGAAALAFAPGAQRVDVVVTGDRHARRRGARLALARVPLLSLERRAAETGLGSTHAATLGVTRAQAVELVGLVAGGAVLRLLPSPGRSAMG